MAETSLALDPEMLTHDMDEADALQAGDAQSQAVLEAGLASTKQSADLRQQAEQAKMANGINRASALQASANTVGNYHTRLNEPAVRAGSGAGYYAPAYYPTVVQVPEPVVSSVTDAAPGLYAPPSSMATTSSSAHPSRSTNPVPKTAPMRAGPDARAAKQEPAEGHAQ